MCSCRSRLWLRSPASTAASFPSSLTATSLLEPRWHPFTEPPLAAFSLSPLSKRVADTHTPLLCFSPVNLSVSVSVRHHWSSPLTPKFTACLEMDCGQRQRLEWRLMRRGCNLCGNVYRPNVCRHVVDCCSALYSSCLDKQLATSVICAAQ